MSLKTDIVVALKFVVELVYYILYIKFFFPPKRKLQSFRKSAQIIINYYVLISLVSSWKATVVGGVDDWLIQHHQGSYKQVETLEITEKRG